MLNVLKLKGKIVEQGKNVATVSAELGISTATFYHKMKTNTFNIMEALELKKILSLTTEEASAIFFSDSVA